MQKAQLFYEFITREKRMANKIALMDLIAKFTGDEKFEFNVDGCQITNTSSYVDISYNAEDFPNDDFLMHSFTYVIFSNNNENYKYCAFIDRVEPCNFNVYETSETVDNEEVKSKHRAYRLYITIDWWSTIMYNDSSDYNDIEHIKSSLEGNVERAHVNDVVYEYNNWHHSMENTSYDPEFPIDKFLINGLDIAGNKHFLYVLSAEPRLLGGAGAFNIGEKEIATPLNLYIIPMFTTKFVYKVWRDSILNTYEIDHFHFAEEPEILADSSIVSIFCTNICTLYNKDTNSIELPEIDLSVFNQEDYDKLINSITKPKIFSTVGGGQIEAHVASTDFNAKSYENGSIVTRRTIIYKPEKYNQYLDIITKQYFEPYNLYEIFSGNESVVVHTDACREAVLFEYNIIPSVGGMSIKLNEYDRIGESSYKFIGTGRTYERIGTSDAFTQRRRWTLILDELSQHFKSSQSLVNSAAIKNFGTTTGVGFEMISNPIKTYNSYKKLERDGETGYSVQSEVLNQYLYPLSLKHTYLYDTTRNALRKDLALYGYNTFLHPHTVLEEHQRKYFNYIKCNNARVLTNSYNTEIRLQIEEMFNNGVWLWNTADEFGNFEVPNYPIIMEQQGETI